ncbi:MAG: hypothetical protein ABJB69_03255 [Spartobacteria bacterium]
MQFFMTRTAPKPSNGPVIKRLLVRCPSTAKLTPSGQTINEALWEKAKIKSHKMTCPHCRQVHTWTKKDVVLAR